MSLVGNLCLLKQEWNRNKEQKGSHAIKRSASIVFNKLEFVKIEFVTICRAQHKQM